MAVTNIYAALADVQALINALGGPTLTLDGSSTPTNTQTEGWLDQVAAEVDAVLLGQGYTLPSASDTNDVLLLKRYVAQKAASMVYHAGFMFDDLPDKVGRWAEEYDTFIERLLDGKMRLIDSSPRSKVGSVTPQRYRGS